MSDQGNSEEHRDWPLAGVVERNIRALIRRRTEEERRKTRQQRIADSITRFTGSIRFVYLHIGLFGVWIVLNLPWFPGPKFDPTYVILAMFASVEAIFLSTFVLMTQNRMAQEADKRAELDLQISLLAEHEVTRLLNLVTAVAEKLQVDVSRDPELDELRKDVPPEKVLDAMEHSSWTPQS